MVLYNNTTGSLNPTVAAPSGQPPITIPVVAGDGILRVPYAGYKGDYQSIPTIVPTASNYPWVARYGGTDASGNLIWDKPGALGHLDQPGDHDQSLTAAALWRKEEAGSPARGAGLLRQDARGVTGS